MTRLDFFFIPFAMDVAAAMSQIMVNLRALDLGASATLVGMLAGLAWGVTYVLAALRSGPMVTRFGARRMMLVGALACMVGLFAYGLATAPWHLLVTAPLAGAGAGVFWPALQTCLKVPDVDETRVRAGIFNVSWTSGILAGTGLSGHAYRAMGPHWSFFSAAGLVLAVFVMVLFRVRGASAAVAVYDIDASAAEPAQAPGLGIVFLRMAWTVNFVMWMAGSAAGTVFPRLARSLHLSDGSIGEIAAMVWLGQMVFFGLLSSGGWWHYRRAAFLAGMLTGVAALALFAVGRGAAAFAVASVLLGAARTPGHLGSIHYGLHSGGNRDANMGYHEAVLGAGCVLGPVLSGIVADWGGVRAPFWGAAGVVLAAMCVVALWPLPKRQVAASPGHCREEVGSE